VRNLIVLINLSLEDLLSEDQGAEIILGGDFNPLIIEEITARAGLTPLLKV